MKPRAAKHTGRPPDGTEDWADAFLGALLEGLHVRDAAKVAVVHYTMVYRRRATDEAFREAMGQALILGTELLEGEACRRAFHGTIKPVFHLGEQVGEIREYSDVLLMFLLRARKPETYREYTKVEHVGKGDTAFPAPVLYLPDNGRHLPEVLDDVGPDDTAIG